MNYLVNTTLGQKERTLVLGIKNGNKMFNIMEILGSNITNSVLLDVDEGIDFPFLIPKDKDNSGENLDITALYKIFYNSKFEIKEEVMKALCQKLASLFSEEDIRGLLKISKDFYEYITADSIKTVIKFPSSYYAKYEEVKEMVDKINSSGEAKPIYIEGENKTLFMTTPESELFIRVPSYEELTIGETNFPNPKDIFYPYPKDKMKVLTGLNYKRGISKETPIEFVIGNIENNELPIQDNERRYYNALVALMDYGIEKERPNVSLEECKKNKIGSQVVRDYLIDLILLGAYMNWLHTGGVPINLAAMLCEGDEEDSEEYEVDTNTDSSEGKRAFYSEVAYGGVFKDYQAYLEDKMANSVFVEDPYALIDIAIRMLRWGDRKPSRIKLPDNTWLDLNSFTLVESSGNFSNSEIYIDDEGNNLFPIGVITMTDYMSSRDYISRNHIKTPSIDMPVGILCLRKFCGTDETQIIAMSFIDVIKAYENNETSCKIKGLRLVNNQFEFTEQFKESVKNQDLPIKEIVSTIKSDTKNKFKYYQYGGFVEAYFEMECFDKNTSILSIINEYYSLSDLVVLSMCAYETTQELKDIIVSTSKPPREVINANIARYMIPLFCLASSKYEDKVNNGVQVESWDIINIFKMAMDENGFIGTFNNEMVPTVSSKQTDSDVNSSKSTSFSKEEKVEDNKVSNSNSSVELVNSQSIDGMTIARIYLRADVFNMVKEKFEGISELERLTVNRPTGAEERVVVGYCALNEKNQPSVLLNAKNVRNDSSKTVNALQLNKLLSKITKQILFNKPIDTTFEDVETGAYYVQLISSIINVSTARL